MKTTMHDYHKCIYCHSTIDAKRPCLRDAEPVAKDREAPDKKTIRPEDLRPGYYWAKIPNVHGKGTQATVIILRGTFPFLSAEIATTKEFLSEFGHASVEWLKRIEEPK